MLMCRKATLRRLDRFECSECGKDNVDVCDGCGEYLNERVGCFCIPSVKEHYCRCCLEDKKEAKR